MNKNEIIILSVENLYFNYENTLVLDNVSFNIPKGSRCAIIGPNGAGKTTLMKCLIGLEKFKYGKINIYNNEKNNIAYIPQRKFVDWTFPITVYEVVLMGAYDIFNFWNFTIPKEVHKKTEEVLKLMNLYDLRNNHINDLSGGQQQRVFIARALAQNGNIYLMDEPLTGLDRNSEVLIFNIFKLVQSENKTIIAVHHDWKTAREYFDWVILLNKEVIYFGLTNIDNFEDLLQKTFE